MVASTPILVAEVARLTQGGRTLFAWLCDFNEPPDKLDGAKWVTDLHAQVIRPADRAQTCWARADGSCIDYAVVSQPLVSWLSLRVVSAVPWGPHEGLAMSLASPPAAQQVRALAAPAPLPRPTVFQENLEQG